MTFRPDKPYNDLPRLPPRHDLETKSILKLCIAARAALAELDAVGDLIPNPAILINTIPFFEARASSEIENIVTTNDRLFRMGQGAPFDGDADPATKEASRYRTALNEGYRSLSTRPLSSSTALRICSVMKNVDMEVRRVSGTVLRNSSGTTIYTPPVGESVLLDLLGDWERYLHDTAEIDPLIRMAVAHYQFEAIHPFTDGNGRTGRILNILYLVDRGLLRLPVLYLSQYILANRAEYYRLLLDVTANGTWEAWIAYMLTGIVETAQWTTKKVRAIKAQMQVAKDHMRLNARQIYSHELLDILFTYPYCRIDYLVSAGIVKSRQTASVYLKTLCDMGMLVERKAGTHKLFVHETFFDLLTSDENQPIGYGPLTG